MMYAGDSGITVIRMQPAINADKLSEASQRVQEAPASSRSVSVSAWAGYRAGYLHYK